MLKSFHKNRRPKVFSFYDIFELGSYLNTFSSEIEKRFLSQFPIFKAHVYMEISENIYIMYVNNKNNNNKYEIMKGKFNNGNVTLNIHPNIEYNIYDTTKIKNTLNLILENHHFIKRMNEIAFYIELSM